MEPDAADAGRVAGQGLEGLVRVEGPELDGVVGAAGGEVGGRGGLGERCLRVPGDAADALGVGWERVAGESSQHGRRTSTAALSDQDVRASLPLTDLTSLQFGTDHTFAVPVHDDVRSKFESGEKRRCERARVSPIWDPRFVKFLSSP